MNSERLLERFLRYVRIDTMAREGADTYPSSPGQLELGRLLLGELQGLKLADAQQNEFGIVTATVPATKPGAREVIALNSHFDTSPETTAAGVRPQVIRNYAGGDIPLPGAADRVIRAADNPQLAELHGRTLITTDGTTLLGADDKAGLAVIMETAQWLCEHPEIPHGPIRLCFTCDEEIGHGVDHVDLAALRRDCRVHARRPGGRRDRRRDIFGGPGDRHLHRRQHSSLDRQGADGQRGADGGRLSGRFASGRLFTRNHGRPRRILAPLYDRRGRGGDDAAGALARFRYAAAGRAGRGAGPGGREVEARYPGGSIRIDRRQQYRNLGDGLAKEPRAVAFAEEALKRLRRTPRRTIVRGGTDGSRLTELGLPTPNLSCGQHNPHSPLEWACLDEMLAAVEMLVMLAQIGPNKRCGGAAVRPCFPLAVELLANLAESRPSGLGQLE